MFDISKFHIGDIVCHRFTWRRYRVVRVDKGRFRVLVVSDCRGVSQSPTFWMDIRLLEVLL